MILCAGDLMLDILLLPDLQAEEQPSGIAVRPGGSAANTAAWIAYTGADATFAGCVGDDPLGETLTRDLQRGGVVTRIRVAPGLETGAVAVQVQPDGDRVMRSARGANAALCAADLDGLHDPEIVAVHLTGYALLCPAGWELVRAVGALAQRSSALFSLDPSSVGVIEHLGAERLLDEAHRAGVGLLLPNALEAAALTGRRDPADAAHALSDRFPRVVVKDGAHGAVCGGDWPHRVPAQPCDPLDTTGAGDAFDAGLLLGLCRGAELVDACHDGHRLAAQACARRGARPAHRM